MTSKSLLLVNTIIALFVAIALVIGAALPEQYSYYTFLRWLVMTSFIYFAWQSYIKIEIGLLIFFVAIAIMFNPFKIVWFQKEIWHLIDYSIAAIMMLIMVYKWFQVLKRKNKSPDSDTSLRNYKRSKIMALILIIISLSGVTIYSLERYNYLDTNFIYQTSAINQSEFSNGYPGFKPPRFEPLTFHPPKSPSFHGPEISSREYINRKRIGENTFNFSLTFLGFIGLIGIFILIKQNKDKKSLQKHL